MEKKMNCIRCPGRKSLSEMVKCGQDHNGRQKYRNLCKECRNSDQHDLADRNKAKDQEVREGKDMREADNQEPKRHHSCLTPLHLRMAKISWTPGQISS